MGSANASPAGPPAPAHPDTKPKLDTTGAAARARPTPNPESV